MKQVMQNLSDGKTFLVEAPSPGVSKNHVLINTVVSLISAGTEKMLVDFGKSSYFKKALNQPDKVKMVFEKASTEGVFTTIDSVKSKLEQPIPLGYCNVGVVQSIGNGVLGLKKGDRVVSNGSHADVVKVPKNLCVKVPDGVDNDTAAFTVAASIGLQGMRLAETSLGESVVVIGGGLIGLLTVQLLCAQGCRVMVVDFDKSKLDLAAQFGAEICDISTNKDPVEQANSFSRGRGVDAVLITASSASNEPIKQAANMCRKRGRIILVGVVGLNLTRDLFYQKELTFKVSCSYGPGRYDPSYEEEGNDYPAAYVRWTEQRNFEAVLDMMAVGKINVKPLITNRFLFEDAESAYRTLIEKKSNIGVLLDYKTAPASRHKKEITVNSYNSFDGSVPVLNFLGAGNYASRVLIPAFKKTGVRLGTLTSAGGVSCALYGKRFGFIRASTDTDETIKDISATAVVIATKHNNHAELVVKSIEAGKHVYVEKPLAISRNELSLIEKSYKRNVSEHGHSQLMVGFNRRFSPLTQKMKELLATVNEPKSFIMTMNAGEISREHWTQNFDVGGGRIIGEACHYIDLMRYLADSKIVSVQARRMGDISSNFVSEDKASITLGFADGSFGTILYFSNGSPKFQKERIEVFTSGKILKLDNFKSLVGYGWRNFSKLKLWKQNKGQLECAKAFLSSIKERDPAIPISQIFEVADVSLEVAQILRDQK